MPVNRDEWLTRIKSIERRFDVAQAALKSLIDKARHDASVLNAQMKLRDISDTLADLEPTYLVRMFSEFESGLRSFWNATRKRRRKTPADSLLDRIASQQRIPNEQLLNAHAVRLYRNSISHEQDDPGKPIEFHVARGHLCRFFSRLPASW